MQLYIRGDETLILNCDPKETVGEIKERLLSGDADFCTAMTLHCQGIPLPDETRVSDLGSDTLEMTVPLLGGKVHGSLSRAGKVRSQTPKVEKQDKPKKKTGRAKRRQQYNRRILHPVTDGSKPNAIKNQKH